MMCTKFPRFSRVKEIHKIFGSNIEFYLIHFFNSVSGSLEDESVIDLTSAISIPLPTGVQFVSGPEGAGGFPAFQISSNANVQRPAETILPRSFPTDFAITVRVKLNSADGGVLFAITSEDSMKVYLSLEILPVRTSGENVGQSSIRFTYFNPYFPIKETMSFNVEDFTKQWMSFSLGKQGDALTLYYDCPAEKETKVSQKSWGAFFIPGTSLFYIGKAGQNPNHRRFEVSFLFLFI